MKRLSRIVPLILSVALFLALAVPSAGAAFSDVSSSKWYAADVNAMEQYGILNGTGKGKFSPDMSLTLAQAITMASRVHAYTHNLTIPAAKPGEQWYAPYLDYADQKGFCTTGQYGTDYDSPCSRLIMAYLFADVFPMETLYSQNLVSNIPDVPNTPEYDSVYFLYMQGVLTGNDKFGTFYPNRSITRAETAAILHRVLNTEARKSFTLETAPDYETMYHKAAVNYFNQMITAANLWGWGGFDFTFYDIDKNGVKEMLIRTTNSPDTLVGIFTICNNQVMPLYEIDVTDALYREHEGYIWGSYLMTDGTIATEYCFIQYPEDNDPENIQYQFMTVEFWTIGKDGYSPVVRESAVCEADQCGSVCFGSKKFHADDYGSAGTDFAPISEEYFIGLYSEAKGYTPIMDLETLNWQSIGKG